MGPKKGKMMARNQMGTTTGNLAAARLQRLLHSCIPIAFSHTKYRGVHANPKVMNCSNTTTCCDYSAQEYNSKTLIINLIKLIKENMGV